MSLNCILCVVNQRNGPDLLCEPCRQAEAIERGKSNSTLPPSEDPLYLDDEDFETCERCGGDGTIEYADAGPSVWGEDIPSEENHLITCPDCNGEGRWPILTAASQSQQNTKSPVPSDAGSKKESI